MYEIYYKHRGEPTREEHVDAAAERTPAARFRPRAHPDPRRRRESCPQGG